MNQIILIIECRYGISSIKINIISKIPWKIHRMASSCSDNKKHHQVDCHLLSTKTTTTPKKPSPNISASILSGKRSNHPPANSMFTVSATNRNRICPLLTPQLSTTHTSRADCWIGRKLSMHPPTKLSVGSKITLPFLRRSSKWSFRKKLPRKNEIERPKGHRK